MKYQIVCKNTKISSTVQEKIIGILKSLEKLLNKSEDFECRVVILFKDKKSKVEVSIPTPYLLLRSEVESEDLLDSVEIAKEKLIVQIEKIKTRLDRSSKKVNLGRTFGEALYNEPIEDIYIKNKEIHPNPMTLDDAIMEMEASDHDFFIYDDIEDHHISVVYKRKSGGYGVIDII